MTGRASGQKKTAASKPQVGMAVNANGQGTVQGTMWV